MRRRLRAVFGSLKMILPKASYRVCATTSVPPSRSTSPYRRARSSPLRLPVLREQPACEVDPAPRELAFDGEGELVSPFGAS